MNEPRQLGNRYLCGVWIVTSFVCVSICLAPPIFAQGSAGAYLPPRVGVTNTLPAPTAVSGPSANSSGAFALEALGGIAGSVVGMAIVAGVSNCDVEDLACTILTVGAAGAVSALGATAGATLVARQIGSHRSIPGALLGAVAGTGVGLGLHYLLNRQSDRNLGDKVVAPIFALAQGVFAAWGSRLVGR